jgi:GNAT superfamily N-acetyltransferase
MTGAEWTFRAVTAETWPDMAALFEGRGGPSDCWCMHWRKDATGQPPPRAVPARRAAIAGLAQSGRQIGLLGYDQGTPIAWCSVAPRTSFGNGLGTTAPDPGLWSLTCFFIRADHRKQSGFAALLTAAETFAAAHGAAAIESYPVAPDSPSYRFSGFVPSFEKAGYQAVGTIGTRRHVMRKTLLDQD